MLGEEFEMWLIDLLFDVTLITIGIYVINLGYLKNRYPYFIEFLNSSIEESNKMLVRLDTIAVILEINN